jgi:hypothetical protein
VGDADGEPDSLGEGVPLADGDADGDAEGEGDNEGEGDGDGDGEVDGEGDGEDAPRAELVLRVPLLTASSVGAPDVRLTRLRG